MTRHRVPYPEKYLNIWIMYDVYDLKADGYLPQKQVKALAAEVGVPYIHVLYDGPFVDWDHCRSFMRIYEVYGWGLRGRHYRQEYVETE